MYITWEELVRLTVASSVTSVRHMSSGRGSNHETTEPYIHTVYEHTCREGCVVYIGGGISWCFIIIIIDFLSFITLLKPFRSLNSVPPSVRTRPPF